MTLQTPSVATRGGSYVFGALSVLLLVMAAGTAHSQINTESMLRADDDGGWAYDLALDLSLRRGNTDETGAGANTTLRYLTLHHDKTLPLGGEPWFRHRFMMTGRWAFETSSGSRTENKAFSHIRWTHMWKPRVGHELFGQIQFDEFRLLDRRVLAGANLRFVALNGPVAQLWFGTGYFAEFEQFNVDEIAALEAEFDRRPTHHRWNTYVTFRLTDASERVAFAHTLYLQPRINALHDVQILYDGSLAVEIVGPLEVGVGLHILHDSRPAPGVDSTDVALRNFLRVSI